VLAAFKAQPHVVAARLYLYQWATDRVVSRRRRARPGRASVARGRLPISRAASSPAFSPVVQGGRRMGTLYLESDLGEIYEHFQLFVLIGASIMLVCCIAAYLISRRLRELISRPILSARHDRTAGVRAP